MNATFGPKKRTDDVVFSYIEFICKGKSLKEEDLYALKGGEV